MKKLLIITSLLTLTVFWNISHAKSGGEQLDQIVAIVNDDVVTKTELNHSLYMARAQISQGQTNAPTESVLQKQVLNQLINKKLQLQIAKQVGINITDTDIDHALQNIASQNNISVSDIYTRVNQDGMSTTVYRNEMRDQMTIQKLQQQQVGSRINIAPGEIDSFLRSKLWQTNSAKEYHLEDILIPLSDTPSTDEIERAKTHAKSVIAQLRQGKDVQEVAQQETSSGNAMKSDDMGWRSLSEIPSAFTRHVISMQAKDIVGPVQTSNGFHILRLLAERSDSSNQAAPTRQQVEAMLMQRKFEEQVQNWVSKMRSQAFVVMNPVKS